MIKRINLGCVEGDIVELDGFSEPLYLYHNYELVKITPKEYNECINELPENRWKVLRGF